MNNDKVPLCLNNELRPRGTSDNPTGELAKIARNHCFTSLNRIDEIADRACREDNPIVEAQLRAKLADLGTKLLNLERTNVGAKKLPMTSEDLPDWDAFPDDVAEYFEKGFTWMKEKYGEEGVQKMMTRRD